MVFGLFIAGLYLANEFLPSSEVARMVRIPVISALTAALAVIVAVVFRLRSGDSFMRASLALVYGLATISVGTLLYFGDTGSMSAVPLWFLLALTSTVVYWGYGLLFVVIGLLYILMLVIDRAIGFDVTAGIIYATILPVIVGWILWGRRSIHYPEIHHSDTDLEKLASKLSHVNGKADIVINAIDDGVIALDNEGVVELINPAAQRIIGWQGQDAIGLNYASVLKLVDDKDHQLTKATDPVEQVIANNQQIETEKLSLVTSSGKTLNISLVVSPVGQLGQGVIIVFRDITTRRREEMQQTEFISTASHEMRTPVASIEGYLGLALNPQTATIDDKARDYITKAHESAQHLGRLFQDLLDITKSDDGRMSNNPRVVEVVPFVKDICEGLVSKAEDKGLTLKFMSTVANHDSSKTIGTRLSPAYFIHVDRDHLREVVGNIIENGIKYTKEGSVTVNVDGDAHHVRILVSDTGIGIPKEDQTHLFQKFYRIDNSDTREIGGTGLGLYLCRVLTEQMGGKIWLDSTYGEGSTFTIEFPRPSATEVQQMQTQEANEEARVHAEEAKQAAAEAVEATTQQSPAPEAQIEPTSVPEPTTTVTTPPEHMTLSAIESNKQLYTYQRDTRPSIPERK